ncbi:MAG: molybdopterin-dependent oxidoreductase [Desulfobacterales bacterium]|jgi:sulfoxide reductase catalytic subunit YedY
MNTRRRFFKAVLRGLGAVLLLLNPIVYFTRSIYAETKRIILPKGTRMNTLVNKNPTTLDARNLEVIPLNQFETMGLTDHKVDLDTWRLEVSGKVSKPLKLSYEQLLELPYIDRKVLLICPGVFANYGQWRGISVLELLKAAQEKTGITHVSFHGPPGPYEKKEQFPIEEIASNKVFLAYQVNGKVLPQKHGFPLRVVAEDHYGSEWVKFVFKVNAHKIQA